MFFKKLISSISPSRLIIYLVIFSLLPSTMLLFQYCKEKKVWSQVLEEVQTTHLLAQKNMQKQQLNALVKEKYKEADSLYLEKQFDHFTFLKKEIDALQTLLCNPSFTGNEVAERRYSQLVGETNRLQFKEGGLQAEEGILETLLIPNHSVEIDQQDIRELLLRIEGNLPNKPQLIVYDFKLNKKKYASGNEVFELNLKILKREFTR